ncbi:tetratricopeptide TPR_2 [Halothece sp. PCC 7418]|uniref:tetratricopeptide repeat protein n=1 Tax=Halothece sp. (strain PCC 7418) TaxID=65093 RepID=UPI0002A08470|nr:tetratricopeptide repeat protein [Halothece sp. PCC 7418]AFZ45465.1 tetratricopeptide TPR_2 [Halothece sp. PCC 7418]
MSSSPDQKKNKTWILVVIGIIVVAFVGVSVIPFLNPDSPQQANNPSSAQTPPEQANLADQARGYEAVLEKEPDNESALQGLIEVRIQQGDIEGALPPLEKLADLNPDQQAYRILLAQAKQQVGDLEGAADAYRTILDNQPGDPRALQGLVDLLLQQNRPEAAIGELKDTLALAEGGNEDINTTSIKLLLAQVYGRTEQFDGAIALYEEVADSNPGDFRPVLGQALVQQEKGDDEAAKPLYEKAFDLAPAQFKDQIKQMTPLLTDENTTQPEAEENTSNSEATEEQE